VGWMNPNPESTQQSQQTHTYTRCYCHAPRRHLDSNSNNISSPFYEHNTSRHTLFLSQCVSESEISNLPGVLKTESQPSSTSPHNSTSTTTSTVHSPQVHIHKPTVSHESVSQSLRQILPPWNNRKALALDSKSKAEQKRQWFNGKIHRCHRWAPRSIRG
jgi:hypothetical protein